MWGIPTLLPHTQLAMDMEGTEDYLEALRSHLPPEVLRLPEEAQLEYISQLLSHQHRHRREEEEQAEAYSRLMKTIAEHYRPLHGHLYQLSGWELVAGFREAVESGDQARMRAVLTEETPGVYTFEMLTGKCCRELAEEVRHFEQWCKASKLKINRPNSMNNYGAILDDFGFQTVLNQLMVKYVQPLSTFLYPLLGRALDSHHGFMVEYELGKDTNLGFHVDDSEVTLNVCLGHEFTGGQLYFRGVRCDRHVNTQPKEEECSDLQHKIGKGILHVGHHRHGANDLTSGHRCNLILWCRSSEQRTERGCGCAGHTPCPEWCSLHKDMFKY